MQAGRAGAALVIHGGGPSPVMNASLAGLIEARSRRGAFSALWGARFGLAGLMAGRLVDLTSLPAEVIRRLPFTPGSVLGSCRQGCSQADLPRLIEILRHREIRYVFFNGGNGTMFAADMLRRAADDVGYEMTVVGIPKTIDNDLNGTDHSPGYGSAARFVACAVRDIGSDLSALRDRVTVVETMGRNGGWLSAASALARAEPDDPPHLIYVPERPVSAEQILADVSKVYDRLQYSVVVVSEGQTDEQGNPFGADRFRPDGFGRCLTANLAHTLAQLLASALKIRARSEKPGLLGRSSPYFVSAVDRGEADLCGRAALAAALAGETGRMVALVRRPGRDYRAETTLVDLQVAASGERPLPAEWIPASASDVSAPFTDWLRPLTGPIEPRLRLPATTSAAARSPW